MIAETIQNNRHLLKSLNALYSVEYRNNLYEELTRRKIDFIGY